MSSVCPRCRREPTRPDGICEVHGLFAIPAIELENLGRAPLLGHIVEGRYALTGHIGAGGMGAVYRAWQLGIERDVAFKILHSAAASGALARARFRREAQVIAGLQSDHTVRVFDFGEVTDGALIGTLYMVMDLVEGFSLSERLRGGPLLLEEVELVLGHVANSVDEAHLKGIVHRDLKPSNILLTEHQGQRRAKVIDFGIARTEDSDQTHAGNALGTPAYMAPELWPSDHPTTIDGRVDVYAMGVVLYQMLTGRKPFPGRDMVVLAEAHKLRAPPALSSTDPRLAAFDPVIARAMAKNVEQRYPTLGALAVDFARHRAAVEQHYGATDAFTWTHPPPAPLNEQSGSSQLLQGAVETATALDPEPPARRGSRVWPVLALVAIGVAIGLTVLMQMGTREGVSPPTETVQIGGPPPVAAARPRLVMPVDEPVMRAAPGGGEPLDDAIDDAPDDMIDDVIDDDTPRPARRVEAAPARAAQKPAARAPEPAPTRPPSAEPAEPTPARVAEKPRATTPKPPATRPPKLAREKPRAPAPRATPPPAPAGDS
ncbi:MAG: protein kinase, partial [bacterium]